MGADGHIDIWADEKVRAEWPDCDELFKYLPTHYMDYLEGKAYHHLYIGDNLIVNWADKGDWWLFSKKCSQEFLDRLQEFVEWLHKNIDASWEVWT